MPVLSEAHKTNLKVEQLGDLRECDSVERNIVEVYEHYARYKGDNALLKAVFRCFRTDICWQLVLNTVVAILTFGSPFLIMLLITFIQAPNRYPELDGNAWLNIEWGVYYSIALVLSQLFAYLLQEHMFYL